MDAVEQHVSKELIMWSKLTDSHFIRFYEEFEIKENELLVDMKPMLAAIDYLRSQAYADQLFAFTSIGRLCITTAPSYQECERHRFVVLLYYWPQRSFKMKYSDEWIAESWDEPLCTESELPKRIDELIRRLIADASASSHSE